MRTLLLALTLLLGVDFAAAAQKSQFGIPSTSGAGGVQTLVSTVAQLPICDVSHIGILRTVVDAAATPVWNVVVAGGGTVVVGVMCNGTQWVKQ